ncbi:hypothetical protein OAT16_09015 [Prolixibacteraceae bacterium]|uniref:hypothetical protein n=1 Tax=Halosquirtibacter xylanolyticus TaxID=3374599 RepID=UPI0037488B9E|nr:hypothetical protein [Prolixibacteraceae bacterium]QZT36905.1 hypothetical protein K5X82_16965 [Prolixibacteraceae bacterium]
MKLTFKLLLIFICFGVWSCEPTEVGVVEDYKKPDPAGLEALKNDIQVNVRELAKQIYEVEYVRGAGGEDSKAIQFITWDFGNGETSKQEKDTIYYIEPGKYNITFNGYTYDGELSKKVADVDATETLWCAIGKRVSMDNFDDEATYAGRWVNKNKNDTPLFDEYHVDEATAYQFPKDNNVLLIGKSGGWWTETAYDFTNNTFDFSKDGMWRKVALRFYIPNTFEVPEGNFDFNIPESYLNLKIGLNDGSGRQEIERKIKVSELGQWVDVEFDFSDTTFDQVDPTKIESIWFMFTHNWDNDRGAGRDGTGVIMIDDIELIQKVPGCGI